MSLGLAKLFILTSRKVIDENYSTFYSLTINEDCDKIFSIIWRYFMNASQKTLCIFLIVILLYLNFIWIFDLFFSYAFSEKIVVVSLIRLIPLLILLVYYFATRHYHEKLSVNRLFFILSIVSLIIAQIHCLLYYYLFINKINNSFVFIMHLLFLLFFILAFRKNLKKDEKTGLFLFLIIPIFLFLQLFIVAMLGIEFISLDYTNPSRYEFVKYHYLTEPKFSILPDKLPEDATNITFEYNDSFGVKTILLEYDSQSVNNDEKHAKYEISSSL